MVSSRGAQGAVILAAAAVAALRAMRRMASVRLPCWSVRGKSCMGGSGGKSACGAGCGGGGVVLGVKAGGGAGYGGFGSVG